MERKRSLLFGSGSSGLGALSHNGCGTRPQFSLFRLPDYSASCSSSWLQCLSAQVRAIFTGGIIRAGQRRFCAMCRMRASEAQSEYAQPARPGGRNNQGDRISLAALMMHSEAAEELQQGIAGFEPAHFAGDRGELFECTLFQLEISFYVAVRCFDAFMSQPQRNHRNVHA